jgi:hypothetical protein
MLHHHDANVKVTTVLGSIPASSVGRYKKLDKAVMNTDHKIKAKRDVKKLLWSKFYKNQVQVMINGFIAYTVFYVNELRAAQKIRINK